MPASLSFDEHVDALAAGGRRLAELATAAGLDAEVPTCPTWSVAHLVAHQSMVHRWAASHVRGEGGDAPSQTAIRESEPDLLGYYREGHEALLRALLEAPADLKAMRFLNDAGTPREFWARRQAHETTIHMIDALAACVGRFPSSAEADLPLDLAVDGIDELLRGFMARGKSKLYDGQEFVFEVAPTDSNRRWHCHVAERLTVTDEGVAEACLSGPAAALYVGLWNRGDEITVEGNPDLLDHWRTTQRIRWS